MKKFLVLTMAAALTCGALYLSACSEKKEYSVLCGNSKNGYVILSGKNAKAGEKVILAAKPNAGYKLTSFVLDGEVLDGCSFVMPKKDVTVSATFEAVTYSISYVLGDATLSGSNPETYTVESIPKLNAPEKEGYEICGWYRYCTEPENNWNWNIEDFRVTSLEGLYGNLTLYAKYYNPPHEIFFEDSENGSCYFEDYKWQWFYGDTVNLTADPYYGYELDHIAVNGETIEGTSFTMPAGDVTVTAVFKPVVCEITYNLFGGENSENNPASFTVEDGYIQLEPAEKEGCYFCGWYSDEDMTEPVYGLSIGDYLENPRVALYAYFIEEDEVTY